jgi:hypothetical protein
MLAAFLAGAAADWIPLATARGGLLRLLAILSGGVFPVRASPEFQLAFHVPVGVAMAVFYAYVVERILPGPSWIHGLVYATGVWLANAVIVLPATGEGFAGTRHLTLAGMLWFAAAHCLFFVVLAVLIESLLLNLYRLESP